jgi:hypothetical protein
MNKRIVLFLALCLAALAAHAQLIVTKELEQATTSVSYQLNTQNQKDNTTPKALIKVAIPPIVKDVSFAGNIVGDVERKSDGTYWVYVSEGTQMLTIKAKGYNDLKYHFPQEIGTEKEKGVVRATTYVLHIEPSKEYLAAMSGSQSPESSFLVDVGFNVLSIMGPSLSLGFMHKDFSMEAGVVYGLNKSKDIYIYNKGGDLQDGYNYRALRGFLHAGYDLWPADILAITPLVGAALTSVQGSRLDGMSGDKVLSGATAISATVGARFTLAPWGKGKRLRISITPEYNLALSKDKNFKALADYDSKIKSWADGLNLNVKVYF